MAEEDKFLIIRHIRVGRDLNNPAVATIRLSANKASGPHLDFVADASTLDQIAAALTRAAAEVRNRAN